MKPGLQSLTVLMAGAATVLAFAPLEWFPLAFVGPAWLFWSWADVSPGRAAWLGFLFGLGLFGAGASWVYVSIHEFGNMPAPMAGLFVFLFVCYLSLYPAAAGWLQARLAAPGVVRLVVLAPALWVLAEWMRGWVMTGFPWLHLGYTQTGSPLLHLAPLVGVYGMSFAVALIAALLALLWRVRAGGRLLAVAVMTLILAGGLLADRLSFVQPAGGLFRVALVQGNVPLREKWRPGAVTRIMALYRDMSRPLVEQSDLIVWPEGAIPDYWQLHSHEVRQELPRRADGSRPDYLFGGIDLQADGHYYNAAIGLSDVETIHRKRHLVPFGEFLPFAPVLGWLIDYLHIPMSDFSAWDAYQPPPRLAGHRAGVNICYEDAFGEELTAMAANTAYLVNLSEDAWFGRSLAPHQRLQMARVRARETGRSFLRAANTGITAVIGPNGVISARLEPYQRSVLTATVQPMQGLTPYVRYGNAPVLLLLVVMVLAGITAGRPRPGRGS